MQKITDDGGIVKIVIVGASDDALDTPVPGSTALLHFKAFLAPFVPFRKPAAPHTTKIAQAATASTPKQKTHVCHGLAKCQTEQECSNLCEDTDTHHADANCAPVDAQSQSPEHQETMRLFASPSGLQYTFNASARRLLVDSESLLREPRIKPGDSAASLVPQSPKGHSGYFELRVGRQLIFPALETAVCTMRIGERSRFLLVHENTLGFTRLATLLRDEHDAQVASSSYGPQRSTPSCGGCLWSSAAAQRDNDLLESCGRPIELEIELCAIQPDGTFDRDTWELPVAERHEAALALQNRAAEHFAAGQFDQARTLYCRAYDAHRKSDPYFENEVTRARLNCALCSLKLEDYVTCVAQCTQILAESSNTRRTDRGAEEEKTEQQRKVPLDVHRKALFRRALAHLRRGRDLDDARRDLCDVVRVAGMSRNCPEWQRAWATLLEKCAAARAEARRAYDGIRLSGRPMLAPAGSSSYNSKVPSMFK